MELPVKAKALVSNAASTVILGLMLTGALRVQGQTAPAAPAPPPPKWESSATLGLALTRGNSDTMLFNGKIGTFRKWEHEELRLGADATYGENSGKTSAQQEHGFGQFNYLFKDRFYGGLRIDALQDKIADVSYRITVAPLAGYYFIKKENTKLSAEVGPGFVFEKQGGQTDSYTTLRLGERFEHKFSDKARMWQTAEVLPQVDDFSNFIFIGELGAEAALTKKVSLSVVLRDTYDNEPAAGRKKNDVALISGITYRF